MLNRITIIVMITVGITLDHSSNNNNQEIMILEPFQDSMTLKALALKVLSYHKVTIRPLETLIILQIPTKIQITTIIIIIILIISITTKTNKKK